jgi:anti-sigma factor ChrR (cupin superfamily)
MIQLNSDFSQRSVVNTLALDWHDSPSAGVTRRMIERSGGEVARATSVVRYAAGARFERHVHELGEEIVVLSGVLSDEHGDYGVGTYLKNPPDSGHAPFTTGGCELFVKLRHLQPTEHERRVVDSRTATWVSGLVHGLSVLPLSEFGTEHTALVRWAPGTYFHRHQHWGGEEIFVLSGVFCDEFGSYEAGTWLRSPHASQHQPFSREGCTIFVKTGHLPDERTPTIATLEAGQ